MPWKCFLDILCQAGKGVHVWATSGSRMGWLNLEGVFHSCCSISLLTISVHSVFRGTSWRRPALETRHWHLVSANLCDLKIGYLCSSHFIGEEPFTAHLFFSTKFRFKRQSTTSGRDLGVSSCRVNGGTVDHRWVAERTVSWCCVTQSSPLVCDRPWEDAWRWCQHEGRGGVFLTRATWWYLKRGLPWCIRFIFFDESYMVDLFLGIKSGPKSPRN